MGHVNRFWRKLTHTRALDQSSGKLEMMFFESVYRIAYLTGLSSCDHDIPYLLYSFVVKLMLVLLVCSEVWYSLTEASGMEAIASCINSIVPQFITFYRYKNMVNHEDIYKKLAMATNSPYFDISTKKRKDLVEYWAKTNQYYLKLLLVLGDCTLAAWYLCPLVDDVDYNMIIGMRFPFNYKTPYRYPITYILVIVVFTYIAHFVMVTRLIMQAHLMHLLCRFTVLADCFENLLIDCQKGFENIHRDNLVHNDKFCSKYLKRLGNLVEQHKLILSDATELRGTLSGPMLGQLAASGVLICFIGYEIATTITESISKCFMGFLFLGYNALELFIICRWSEEITIQSAYIGKAIYCSGWESGMSVLPRVRSTILMVMVRTCKPLVLTAGGMYDLSLTSYATLVKTSYSALTMLLRFRQ